MTYKQIIQYLATFISILGLSLIAFKYPLEGFYVSIIASILWTWYGYITKQWGIIINSMAYFMFEIIGIINWG